MGRYLSLSELIQSLLSLMPEKEAMKLKHCLSTQRVEHLRKFYYFSLSNLLYSHAHNPPHMQTLAKQLNPKNFDFKKYIKEFNFSENFRFNLGHLRGDLLGGLTSAIVALPLALGFGLLAYNGNPEGAVAGLYGAIFTGILASLFGGTPQQITGPTGGMTVILTTVYIQYRWS